MMDLRCIDRLQESKELIKGLCDIMFYMESAEQDAMVPITIFIPFRAVLETALRSLEEAKGAIDQASLKKETAALGKDRCEDIGVVVN